MRAFATKGRCLGGSDLHARTVVLGKNFICNGVPFGKPRVLQQSLCDGSPVARNLISKWVAGTSGKWQHQKASNPNEFDICISWNLIQDQIWQRISKQLV
jgi:hypothetical protein